MAENTKGRKTSLYVTPKTEEHLFTPPRGATLAVRLVAERYNALITTAARSVMDKLGRDDLAAICETCANNEWTIPSIRGGLAALVKDMATKVEKKYNTTHERVCEKLDTFTDVELFALVEYIERNEDGYKWPVE